MGKTWPSHCRGLTPFQFLENLLTLDEPSRPLDYIEGQIYSLVFISILSPRILPKQFILNMPVKTIMDRSTLALYIVA